MSSLKQESRQSSLGNSVKETVLENGSDSSPLSDESSPSSPLEVSSSGGSSSDSSSGGSSSDSSGDSSSDSSSDESSSDDSSDSSSGSSDKKKKKKVVPAVCLLKRLNKGDLEAPKKVYFTEDQCRWTMIQHPVSVNKVKNFVQTAKNAYVDVLFEGEIMNVDITLGDHLEEKLRVSMKASSERNCVTVAEEYQPLEATRCSVLTEDLVNIGSYDPCSGNYPPNGCFGPTDYKLDLQKTRENDGALEFVTEGESCLNFSFGEKEGKDTVHIYFAYGNKESRELAFDFEVSGHDLNVVNLPSALAIPPLSSSLTTTTTTTTTAPLVPPNGLQILHGWTVESPGITRTVKEKAGKEESTTTTTTTSMSSTSKTLLHCGKSEVIAEMMPMQKK